MVTQKRKSVKENNSRPQWDKAAHENLSKGKDEKLEIFVLRHRFQDKVVTRKIFCKSVL